MSKAITISALDHVLTNWNNDAPSWISDLAYECDQTSQAHVARKLGRSASLVNQLLKNKYPGDLKDIEDRFKAAFNSEMCNCPVMGQISGEKCLNYQGKKYDPSNHIAVRLFRACARCDKNLKGINHVK